MTEDEDPYIIAAVVEDPFLSAREIREELELDVSDVTIRRRLASADLHSAMAAQKPLLSPSNKNARLRFAMGHASWTADDWGVFSDESTFSTRQDERVRVWRPHGAPNDPPYVQRVASSGRTSVNVWGAISKHGLGPLHRVVGRLTSTSYCDVVDTVLIPFVRSGLFPNGNFLFQQDLAPIHTARTVKDHLRQCGIEELPWVPKGADLSIIENVWGRMKAAMVRTPIYSTTEDQLPPCLHVRLKGLQSGRKYFFSLDLSVVRGKNSFEGLACPEPYSVPWPNHLKGWQWMKDELHFNLNAPITEHLRNRCGGVKADQEYEPTLRIIGLEDDLWPSIECPVEFKLNEAAFLACLLNGVEGDATSSLAVQKYLLVKKSTLT
ncbi:hypothetical protein HPB47_026796, partial [Ixodes persulcatus]